MDLLAEHNARIADNTVVSLLREVQKAYKTVLHLGWEERERLVLDCVLTMARRLQEYSDAAQAIDEVLTEWPKGEWPHDSSLMEELHKKLPGYIDIPIDSFHQIVMVNRLLAITTDSCFNEIYKLIRNPKDKGIIDYLKRVVDNTFVNNKNIKSGYYKDHPEDMNKKLWEELLDRDFESYIIYFEADPEENENEQSTEPVSQSKPV